MLESVVAIEDQQEGRLTEKDAFELLKFAETAEKPGITSAALQLFNLATNRPYIYRKPQ